MAISLSDIPVEDVMAAETELAAYVTAFAPDADLSIGPLRDQLLIPGSALLARRRKELEDFDRRRSLSALADAGDATDEEIVRAADVYRLAPRPGRASRGSVRIVLSSNLTVVIPLGTIFVSGGITYRTPAGYVAKAEFTLATGANDVTITPLGATQFSFVIPVVGPALPGTAVPPRRGDPLTTPFPIANYVRSEADEDFVSGADAETASSLLSRAIAGAAAPSAGSVAGILAIAARTTSARGESDPQISVVGAGHPELRRAFVPWPITETGAIDIYVRPAGGPVRVTVQAVGIPTAAEDQEPVVNGIGIRQWVIMIPPDVAPAAYAVVAVTPLFVPPQAAAPPAIVSELRPAAAADDPVYGTTYSARQSIQITYEEYFPEGDAHQRPDPGLFDVVLDVPPGLGAISAAIADPAVQVPGIVPVVRAAVPCFVTVVVSIRGAFDAGSVSAAILTVVENLGFVGTLSVARVAAAVQSVVTGDVVAVRLSGEYRAFDGVTTVLAPDGDLVIPTIYERGVTPRTTAFYCRPASISVTAVS